MQSPRNMKGESPSKKPSSQNHIKRDEIAPKRDDKQEEPMIYSKSSNLSLESSRKETKQFEKSGKRISEEDQIDEESKVEEDNDYGADYESGSPMKVLKKKKTKSFKSKSSSRRSKTKTKSKKEDEFKPYLEHPMAGRTQKEPNTPEKIESRMKGNVPFMTRPGKR